MLDAIDLTVFLSASRHLNFAGAAKELRVAPSQISKQIAKLEEKLGKPLFLRTTRLVRLTREGEMFVPLARRALDAISDATELFADEGIDVALSGTIRITCPHTLGVRKIAGLAVDFCRLHPGVTLEFILSDGYLDLIDARIDLAVRIMGLSDSSLIARRLMPNDVMFCASPGYLASHGSPSLPDDLKRHDVYYIPQHGELKFRDAGIKLSKVARPPRIHAPNGDFLVEIARQGGGILVRSVWSVERELVEGSLVAIDLGDVLLSETAIYAVYPAQKALPRRTRLWIDYLAARLKGGS